MVSCCYFPNETLQLSFAKLCFHFKIDLNEKKRQVCVYVRGRSGGGDGAEGFKLLQKQHSGLG